MVTEPRYVRAKFLDMFGGSPDEADLREAEQLFEEQLEGFADTVDAYAKRTLDAYEKWGQGEHLSDEEKVLLADAQTLVRYALDHATPEQMRKQLRAALRAHVRLTEKAKWSPIIAEMLETFGSPTPEEIVDRVWMKDPELARQLEDDLRGTEWSDESMGSDGR